MSDRAALEHDRAVGQRERKIEMVVDDQDRHMMAQPVERLEQFLDDRRRQPLERLVEQQYAGVARQRTRDRDHLLLAS